VPRDTKRRAAVPRTGAAICRGFGLDRATHFVEIGGENRTVPKGRTMSNTFSSQPSSFQASPPHVSPAPPYRSGSRRILWQNVTTVLSAAVLISAEVFGAAFAGGWALANLMGLGDYAVYVQIIFFLLGIAVMTSFVRNAMRVEPFVAPASHA
jgi:hypothetical protein